MCGIFGYVGEREALDIGLEGIQRLEYRGYDSIGMALVGNNGAISVAKATGKLADLRAKIADQRYEGTTGIWHTRWATHGVPSEANAHPHGDCTGKFYVAHNGIIVNYKPLKNDLIARGHTFASETDSEVLAHLIEESYHGDLTAAVRNAISKIEGTYGLVVISRDEPGKIVAARMSSPLLIGVGAGEHFVTSDSISFYDHPHIASTVRIVPLDDGEVALISPNSYHITDARVNPVRREPETIEAETMLARNSEYAHDMLREIFEQPEAIKNSLRGRIILPQGRVRLGGLAEVRGRLKLITHITITACGTAFHAGLIGAKIIRDLAGIETSVELASEYLLERKVEALTHPASLLIAVSQSGETMDTLLAVNDAMDHGMLAIGIVNRVGSSIARKTQAGIYTHAGPEVAVASTKAFTAQLAVFVLLAVELGLERGLAQATARSILEELKRIPDHVQTMLGRNQDIMTIARRYHTAKNFLFLGRGYQHPMALEGALKLKEISYIHAEGYPGGEMKHGPLALIDKHFPTLAIALARDAGYKKMLANIQEIQARHGPLIVIAEDGDPDIAELAREKIIDDVISVPAVRECLAPLITAVPLQLFAYHMGVLRKVNVDRPRNLAKSVTVE